MNNVSFSSKETPKKDNDMVTGYRLIITVNLKKTHFITLDVAEIGIKTIEVFQENDNAEVLYSKFTTTFGEFKNMLKAVI